MYLSNSEASQDHIFIEKSIADCIEYLMVESVASQIGERAVTFTAVLSNAAIANVRDGIVSVPNDAPEDAVVFAAISPGEELLMDSSWAKRTPSQKQAIIKQFEKWSPRYKSAEQLFEENYETGIEESVPSPISPYAAASTNYMSNALSGRQQLVSNFAKSPTKGVALVDSRPVIFLRKDERIDRTPADAVVHELVHNNYVSTNPIHHLRSQEDVDKHSLRTELEAYHLGSIITAHMLVEKSKETPIDINDLACSYQAVQLAVQAEREEVGFHMTDPYNPSRKLIDRFRQIGLLDLIIHTAVDYEYLLLATGGRNSIRQS